MLSASIPGKGREVFNLEGLNVVFGQILVVRKGAAVKRKSHARPDGLAAACGRGTRLAATTGRG